MKKCDFISESQLQDTSYVFTHSFCTMPSSLRMIEPRQLLDPQWEDIRGRLDPNLQPGPKPSQSKPSLIVTISRLTPECEINTCCWRWGCLLHITIIAAAAKSLQSCSTLCDPIDGSPPGSPVPGILQARTLEWVAISFSNAWKCKVKVKSLSRVQLLATPWTAALQAPPSMGLSRQEYWSGVPLLVPKSLILSPSSATSLFISFENKVWFI